MIVNTRKMGILTFNRKKENATDLIIKIDESMKFGSHKITIDAWGKREPYNF
jgi:hypothetical protein